MDYRCATPVLLLLFNRPRHAEAVLERLRSVRPTHLYVHCDGPRSTVIGEAEKVAAVRGVLAKIDWPCEVKTLFRDQNAGLRAGVSGALNWFFGEVERGIVLEDDCMPDLSFFPFCEEMLERYANDEQVMHIGGSNVAQGVTQTLPNSYFFSTFTFVWGWASWSRAWAKMSLNLNGLEVFERNDELAAVLKNPMARAYLYDKFRVTQSGKNSSWAYAWFYSVLKIKGFSIVPRLNLVQNTGIGDQEATHTKKRDPQAELRASSLPFPLRHPERLGFDPNLEQALFYAAQKSRIRLTLWFLLQKIGLR
jgi:hypothetical protein